MREDTHLFGASDIMAASVDAASSSEASTAEGEIPCIEVSGNLAGAPAPYAHHGFWKGARRLGFGRVLGGCAKAAESTITPSGKIPDRRIPTNTSSPHRRTSANTPLTAAQWAGPCHGRRRLHRRCGRRGVAPARRDSGRDGRGEWPATRRSIRRAKSPKPCTNAATRSSRPPPNAPTPPSP